MSETTSTDSTENTGTRPDMFGPAPTRRFTESSVSALWNHSVLQCRRMLTRWIRDPATVIQALIYPAVTLVMLRIVLGDRIGAATGEPAVNGMVPLVVLIGAMFGSVVSAVGLRAERESGLLSRFYTLPIHRAAGLTGRLMAEVVRVVVTSVVIFAAGMALGFRFTQGPLATLLIFLVPIGFGLGFALMVTFMATLSTKIPLVELVSTIATLLMFFNSGFVPVMAYPAWLRPFVENQPMSCAIDTMRVLANGGELMTPLLKTVAWSVGMIAVFAWPAIRGYRRAAENG